VVPKELLSSISEEIAFQGIREMMIESNRDYLALQARAQERLRIKLIENGVEPAEAKDVSSATPFEFQLL
jgi:hypothetical protein